MSTNCCSSAPSPNVNANPLEQSDNKGKITKCNWASAARWVAVACAVVGLFAGVVGLLTYLGTLQVALTGLGAMSTATALYVMIGGFGFAGISLILLVISLVAKCSKKGEGDDPKGGTCFNFCGKNATPPPETD
jgi:hypothetical protein